MGIGDWQDHDVDFDWRRLEDNVTKLRPETLKKISNIVVGAGHHLKPRAIKAVRGDSFVVETNIHYPTDSSLIADGRLTLPSHRLVLGSGADDQREDRTPVARGGLARLYAGSGG